MIDVKEVLTGDISVKESLAGEINNGVEVISPSLIDLEVTPSKEKKTYKHEGSYGYDNVTVNPIPSEYVIPNGTLDITSNGIHNVNEYENVNVNVESIPNLQTKEITPAKEMQVVGADEEYDGLDAVVVNAIPDEYIVPSGELEITENGTYDVKNYASTNINVPTGGGGTAPSIGFTIDKYNSEGYPTKVTVVGMTTLPRCMFYGYSSSTGTTFYNALTIGLEEIVLPDGITKIPDYFCNNCNELQKINLSDNITSIGTYAFKGTENIQLNALPTKLTTIGNYAFSGSATSIKTIPDGVTSLAYGVFSDCVGITQISMNKIKTISGSSTTSSPPPFGNCTNLKAVWVGSAITSSGFNRYTFSGCTSIQKMYIDKPRATVEGFSNYRYAFSNSAVTTDVIICNDDAGFITKEEFDATTF